MRTDYKYTSQLVVFDEYEIRNNSLKDLYPKTL